MKKEVSIDKKKVGIKGEYFSEGILHLSMSSWFLYITRIYFSFHIIIYISLIGGLFAADFNTRIYSITDVCGKEGS